jgi:hypothetical protein
MTAVIDHEGAVIVDLILDGGGHRSYGPIVPQILL